jgi:hypothetical protein
MMNRLTARVIYIAVSRQRLLNKYLAHIKIPIFAPTE